jgi:hypothetical protein
MGMRAFQKLAYGLDIGLCPCHILKLSRATQQVGRESRFMRSRRKLNAAAILQISREPRQKSGAHQPRISRPLVKLNVLDLVHGILRDSCNVTLELLSLA